MEFVLVYISLVDYIFCFKVSWVCEKVLDLTYAFSPSSLIYVSVSGQQHDQIYLFTHSSFKCYVGTNNTTTLLLLAWSGVFIELLISFNAYYNYYYYDYMAYVNIVLRRVRTKARCGRRRNIYIHLLHQARSFVGRLICN